MNTINRQRLAIAIGAPMLIFVTCIFITFTTTFNQHTIDLEWALFIDLLITAPFIYYLLIYNTAIAKTTVFRVFIAGTLLATFLLPKSNSLPLAFVQTYSYLIVDLFIVSYVIYKLYLAKKLYTRSNIQNGDFLFQSRAVLKSLLGSVTLANILASEVAVFYYIFSKCRNSIGDGRMFTTYKDNGTALILYTILALLLVETIGMHFLLQIWNASAAWVLSGISFYACLQLYAHIRSLKARPIVINSNELHLRNGILGGELVLALSNISKVIPTSKNISEVKVIKLALIKEVESHNVVIYVKEPVTVLKAFGIKKNADVVLVSIDKHQDFIIALNSFMAKDSDQQPIGEKLK